MGHRDGALIPLIIVGIVANIATSRIEHYRRASRQATGNVTGFIGEFFGARPGGEGGDGGKECNRPLPQAQ